MRIVAWEATKVTHDPVFVRLRVGVKVEMTLF